MVSARPPPNPARGRVAYPTAANYTSGDGDTPAYLNSEPIHPTSSRDSDRERAQGLKTWWKTFSGHDSAAGGGGGGGASGSRQGGAQGHHGGVFGVPLQQSIEYASVQISTTAEDGALYVWGVVPVVVAKCGLFLKETATEVEGTFRISGSAKRMRELQAIFETGPKYGKNIDWKKLSYTEHDVATIFRRFLTQMPEPIIPFDMYENFREALDPEAPPEDLVPRYKELVHALPDINQYLLLYVLDLLHVFAKNSDKNLMTAANLALIFQPGVLSHPVHAMRPRDHVLSQQVLEFLIEHQDNFLVGMQLKKKKKRQPSSSSPPEPTSPPPPVMTKADADLMLPSDSDDDAPEGGYYVVESSGPQRPLSPKAPTQPLSPRQTPQTSFGTAATRVRSHSLTGASGGSAAHINTQPTIREREELQPSDSDDEAPPGGYEVHQSDFAKNRAAILERNRNRPRTNSDTKATESVIPAAPGATGSARTSGAGASGLNRRKTVPARLLGGRKLPNVRRNSREAP